MKPFIKALSLVSSAICTLFSIDNGMMLASIVFVCLFLAHIAELYSEKAKTNKEIIEQCLKGGINPETAVDWCSVLSIAILAMAIQASSDVYRSVRLFESVNSVNPDITVYASCTCIALYSMKMMKLPSRIIKFMNDLHEFKAENK